MRQRWASGMPIGGTSAGASLMPDPMISYGTSAVTPCSGDIDIDPGLGLLQGVLIDSHFTHAADQPLAPAPSERPADLGIGIDEDTAMIVNGDRFQVLARGSSRSSMPRLLRAITAPGSPRDQLIAFGAFAFIFFRAASDLISRCGPSCFPAARPTVEHVADVEVIG